MHLSLFIIISYENFLYPSRFNIRRVCSYTSLFMFYRKCYCMIQFIEFLPRRSFVIHTSIFLTNRLYLLQIFYRNTLSWLNMEIIFVDHWVVAPNHWNMQNVGSLYMTIFTCLLQESWPELLHCCLLQPASRMNVVHLKKYFVVCLNPALSMNVVCLILKKCYTALFIFQVLLQGKCVPLHNAK